MRRSPTVSKLRYLGLFGLLGLLGLLTDNPGFFGFFGFFGFCGLARVKNDEMLQKNMARAGLNAFVTGLALSSLGIAALSLVRTVGIAAAIIAVVFVVQLLTFVICFQVYERRGEP